MTDLKVVSISKEASIGDNVVEYMEEFYGEVKKGGVNNVIIVMTYDNGDVTYCRANSNKIFTMLGALEVIKHQAIDVIRDE